MSNPYECAKKGLVEYRQIFLPTSDDVKPAYFHYDWSDDLLDGDGHICYEGHRESGKTSLILRAFPLYALTYPSDKWRYIVFIKSNQNQARRALKGIVDEFKSNPFISAKAVQIRKCTADVFSVELKTGVKGETVDVTIEAYGKGASIRGLNNKDVRPGIIVMDDAQDHADMLSEVVPENDWDWFLSDVMFLGQSARIFMIANNLGEKCMR
jgi:hypothetical protein